MFVLAFMCPSLSCPVVCQRAIMLTVSYGVKFSMADACGVTLVIPLGSEIIYGVRSFHKYYFC